jgi:hypothetical protein
VVLNVGDSGTGSLRAAILSVNKDTGTAVDQINFNIPGTGTRTISLKTELWILGVPVR